MTDTAPLIGRWARNTHGSTTNAVLKDYLQSPQFTDKDGKSTGETVFRIGGSMVKSGQPRWQGFLFYALCFFGGLFLVLTSGPGGFDLFAFGGIVVAAIGVVGAIEIVRNRPFTRIFGGPAKD